MNNNISSAQFLRIRRYLPKVKSTRPRKYHEYDLLNGSFYVLRTGCQWRSLPDCYPNWHSVYKYYRKLVRNKILDHILFQLNKKQRNHKPHILVTDSQSLQSCEYLSLEKKGYDGYKKKNGLKRFTLVDVYGTIHGVYTCPANVSEKIGLERMVLKYSNILSRSTYSILGDKGFESKRLTSKLSKYGFTLYAMRSTKRLKRGTVYDHQQNNLHNYLNKQISRHQ